MENKVILETVNLCVGYRKGKNILENVNFTVKCGEMIGVIGSNGAGKSTLLKTLRGILPPLSGKVLVNGKDASELDNKEFALLVAYLQQSMETTFGYTVKDIVMTGRYPHQSFLARESEEDEKIVRAACVYTGVSDIADRPLSMISGGQKQRALLAKVLAQQTPLLLLDEPATGLDIFYRDEIFRICKELCFAGKTIIMVAHELSSAAKFCSRLLLVGKNRIIADGLPEVVMTKENLSMGYGVPMNVVKNPITGTLEVFTEGNLGEEKRKNLLPFIMGSAQTSHHAPAPTLAHPARRREGEKQNEI